MLKILSIAQKDLKILFRDKSNIFWVVVFPMVYALFFGSIFSGGGGAGSIKIAVIDNDRTESSAAFVQKLNEMESLLIDTTIADIDSAAAMVRRGKLVAYVAVKPGFGQNNGFFSSASLLQVGIDPSRKAEKGFLEGMLTQATFTAMIDGFMSPDRVNEQFTTMQEDVDKWGIFNDDEKKKMRGIFGDMKDLFGNTERVDTAQKDEVSKAMSNRIETVSITNDSIRPRSSFEITFPSSILWGLIAVAAAFGISVVMERNQGTFHRLRIAPITRAHILAGKGLACFITCVFVCTFLLAAGILIFGVRVSSPLVLIIGVLASSFAFVGIMMLISVLGRTEESVAGAGWAILMVCAMTGGGMIPLLFMPSWLRQISNFSPVKWAIYSMEGGIWREFTISEMMLPVGILLGVGIIGYVLGVSILSKSDN